MEKREKRKILTKKIIIGILAGFISGFFTSGGGMILVPAFIYILKMEDAKSRATSILCILPMVITSGIIYWKNDFINWKIALLSCVGGIIGGVIGAQLLNKLSIRTLKIIFLGFLIYSAIRMMF